MKSIKQKWQKMSTVAKAVLILFGSIIVLGVLFVALMLYNLTQDYAGLSGGELAMMDSLPQSAPATDSQRTPSGVVSESAPHTGEVSTLPSTDTYFQQYETTDYLLSARSRSFSTLCATLKSLRDDQGTDFRLFDQRDNTCRAEFFVRQSEVERILALFEQYPEVLVQTQINSVTTRYTTLTNELSIVQDQLTETESFIETTQAMYDEVIAMARENNDAAALNRAIDSSIERIDRLRQRQTNLANRVRNLERQQSELAERIDQIRFSVQFNRMVPLQTGAVERKWQLAWQDLKDTFTETSIGLTTGLGIFLLWVIRIGIYILFVIFLLRLLYGFGRYVWQRW